MKLIQAICYSTLNAIGCLVLITSAANLQAAEMEVITIVGERNQEKQVSGSAHYLGADQLDKFVYTDIQRVLRQVPGVTIQVEDGYGLRPNIGIRGVATERSGRITLLEDNVLIAPAPYSAPSAYYFPTISRMHAIEVLKGPAAITQGPYTIGGAMNMISTPIPKHFQGNAQIEGGEDATYRILASYGGINQAGFGFLVETNQWRSDGFQSIDRSDGNTGLDVDDYMLKLSYVPVDSRHDISLKLQNTSQGSEQSYLGLSDADFVNDPYRRYGLSSFDNIKSKHKQQILSYRFAYSDALKFTATAYNNTFSRNWFKTEGIDFDGSASADEMSKTSWFDVIQAINKGGTLNGFSSQQLQNIVDGTADTPSGSIQLRSNSREYFSRGFQLGLDWETTIGSISHEVQVGLRFHEDEEDRLQRNSSYSQQNGQLLLDDLGTLGNAGNRVQEAQAIAVFIHDRIEIGKWVFTPGLRYEDIAQKRTRWEIRFDRTKTPASRTRDNFRDSRSNDTVAWLPGLGVLYSLNDNFTLVGGVHKGFTAPSNSPGAKEEKATNYEFGFRYFGDETHAEVIYFLSDYDNLLGQCTASSGSNCTIGDAFNGDAATVQGLEVLLNTNLAKDSNFAIPLAISYTFIDSQFDSDVANTDFFGNVSAGDPIPYIPENQLNVSIGLEKNNWAVNLNANYVEGVCVRAACEVFESTDSALTFDLAGNYDINNALSLFGKIINITGQDGIQGRQPYGARPNISRTATVGMRLSF